MLPSQGVYCVSGIDKNGKIVNHFAESLSEVLSTIQSLKEDNLNVFVAPGSFINHSRKSENALYQRSFFIDLDVGLNKGFASKEAALAALSDFVVKANLPPPVRIDSGGGIHAYWIFEEDVPVAEWKLYAEKFKALCRNYIQIDPSVTADASRIMRSPDTFNYKIDPPRPTHVIDETIYNYSFDEFKDYLGSVEPPVEAVLAGIQKGLDPDTEAFKNNTEVLFEDIALKSLMEDGCGQIKYYLTNIKTSSEPLWRAVLSVAVRCTDSQEAIHLISEDYDGYTPEATQKKAEGTLTEARWAYSCDRFDEINPGICDKCSFRKKIRTPTSIAIKLKEVPTTPPNTIWQVPSTQAPVIFPAEIKPFSRGAQGGIWWTPPPERDKEGKVHQDPPIQISEHDLFPIKRMFSPIDGECLLMRYVLPNDPHREFVLPMKDAYAQDKFTTAMASYGVMFKPALVKPFMEYIRKWAKYMINADGAEQVRMQMGWTEGNESFVVGNIEIMKDGTTRQTAASPLIRGIARLLKPTGSYALWKECANALNEPGFELHAFAMFCGFGSPLMRLTSTSGVTLCLTGKSSNGKTGALYAGLSIFGDPKELSILNQNATDNGLIGRYLGLRNIMLGIDEVSEEKAEVLSKLIHRISQGKAKIRMQASVNAERELELSASMIGVLTSNQSQYDKLLSHKAAPDGEAARLVEIECPRPAPMMKDHELGKRIFDPLRFNFGHAGIEYMKYFFLKGEAYAKSLIEKWGARFNERFKNDGTYRFYANLVAAGMAGGELAVEAGIVDMDLERIYRDVVSRIIKIKEEVIQVNFVDYKALVANFIYQHLTDFLILDGDRVTSEPKNKSIVGRIEVHNQMQYISKTEFKKYLQELQVSAREFEVGLAEEGVLVAMPKQRLSSGWKAGMSAPPISVYAFKSELPDELIEKNNGR